MGKNSQPKSIPSSSTTEVAKQIEALEPIAKTPERHTPVESAREIMNKLRSGSDIFKRD